MRADLHGLSADCKVIGDQYRLRRVSKAKALREIDQKLIAAAARVDGTLDIDRAYGSFVQALDDHDQQERSAAGWGRGHEPTHDGGPVPAGDPSNPLVLEQSAGNSSSTQIQYPWEVLEIIQSSFEPLNPSLAKTLCILKAMLANPKRAKCSLLTSAHTPEFPDSEWTSLVNGHSVNLDAVLSGMFSTTPNDERSESIGGGLEICFGAVAPSKLVDSSGMWNIAFDRMCTATLFIFPRRAKELSRYWEHIIGLFAATNPLFHGRIISYDQAVCKRVAQRRDLELTAFADSMDIKTAVIDSIGVGVVDAQREPSSGVVCTVKVLAGAFTSAMYAGLLGTKALTAPTVSRLPTANRIDLGFLIGLYAGGSPGFSSQRSCYLVFSVGLALVSFFAQCVVVVVVSVEHILGGMPGGAKMIEVTPTSRQPKRLPWTMDRLIHERAIALSLALDPNSTSAYTSALNSYLTFVKMHDLPSALAHRVSPTPCSNRTTAESPIRPPPRLGIDRVSQPANLPQRQLCESPSEHHSRSPCLLLSPLPSPMYHSPAHHEANTGGEPLQVNTHSVGVGARGDDGRRGLEALQLGHSAHQSQILRISVSCPALQQEFSCPEILWESSLPCKRLLQRVQPPVYFGGWPAYSSAQLGAIHYDVNSPLLLPSHPTNTTRHPRVRSPRLYHAQTAAGQLLQRESPQNAHPGTAARMKCGDLARSNGGGTMLTTRRLPLHQHLRSLFGSHLRASRSGGRDWACRPHISSCTSHAWVHDWAVLDAMQPHACPQRTRLAIPMPARPPLPTHQTASSALPIASTRPYLTLSWARFSKDVQSHTLQISKILAHPTPHAANLVELDASPGSYCFPGGLDFGCGLVDINFNMQLLFKCLNIDNILTICVIALAPTGRVIFSLEASFDL
ncbi:hypothetical protein C8R43DRAFT_1130715 [Mycena crocata]|nr:hypothetical protein C8R43DRAFT_1130715 [Mycena crocata]